MFINQSNKVQAIADTPESAGGWWGGGAATPTFLLRSHTIYRMHVGIQKEVLLQFKGVVLKALPAPTFAPHYYYYILLYYYCYYVFIRNPAKSLILKDS